MFVAFGQILVVLAILFPELVTIWNGVKSLLVAGGVTLLMHCVRDPGKKSERKLFEQWGGSPSIAMLRHRDSILPSTTKARYRDYLAERIPGLSGLTTKREREDPDAADQIYDSAGAWLRAQTRDRNRFGLLLQENTSYGFRRNTLVLRWYAVIVNVVGMVALTVVGFETLTDVPIEAGHLGTLPAWRVAVAAGLLGGHCLVFCVLVRGEWVRIAAERYARQLLEACDTLEREDRRMTDGGGK